MVESYQLDVGIASCSGDGGIVINQSSGVSCEFDAGGMVYYTSGENGECTFNPDNPNDFDDDYCYHGMNNGLGVSFISS